MLNVLKKIQTLQPKTKTEENDDDIFTAQGIVGD